METFIKLIIKTYLLQVHALDYVCLDLTAPVNPVPVAGFHGVKLVHKRGVGCPHELKGRAPLGSPVDVHSIAAFFEYALGFSRRGIPFVEYH